MRYCNVQYLIHINNAEFQIDLGFVYFGGWVWLAVTNQKVTTILSYSRDFKKY